MSGIKVMKSFTLIVCLLSLPSFALADTFKSLDQATIDAIAGTYDNTLARYASNDYGRVTDEIATFTPPIARLLLMSGYNLTSNHSKEVLSCNNRLDENYSSFFWWRMQEELKKVAPKRNVRINESIEEMSTRLAKTPVTEAAKRREYLEEHQ